MPVINDDTRITDREGSNQGGNSKGEKAKPERDGHLIRNHLESKPISILKTNIKQQNQYKFNVHLPHLDNRHNAGDVGTECETKDCRVNAVADHADDKK